jgi:hypothetical protein
LWIFRHYERTADHLKRASLCGKLIGHTAGVHSAKAFGKRTWDLRGIGEVDACV